MDSWTLWHVGLSVKSIEKSKEYYQSLGGKADDSPVLTLDTSKYGELETYGKKGASPWKIKIKFIQMGPLTVELAEPVEGSSYVQQHIEDYGEGADHFGYLVDDIESELKELEERGARVLYHIKGVYAYLDTRGVGGMLFEIIQKGLDLRKLING